MERAVSVLRLLAFDRRWLAEAGVPPGVLAGFRGLAGPYDFLPIENPAVTPVFVHPDYPLGTPPIEPTRGFGRPVFLGAAASDPLVDPKRNTVQRRAVFRARLGDGIPSAVSMLDEGSIAWLPGVPDRSHG